MKFPLSVLDLAPVDEGTGAPEALRNSLDLARLADRLGYTRFWLAEHHNMPGIASSAPEIMIGQVARETERIHVGSGGIMLPNHSPLKVAEWFRTLAALYPDRIDLGIGRAPGTDPVTALALRRSREAMNNAEDFPEQLNELVAFAGEQFPADHPFRAVRAIPRDVPLPPIWLLGSSGYSAQLAAEKGMGFAHAFHINPHGAAEAMEAYREGFKPSERQAQPSAIITAPVVCADTDEEAERLATSLGLWYARLVTGHPGLVPSPETALAYPYTPVERAQAQAYRNRIFVGGPARVAKSITALRERTGADEVMVVTMVYGHANRRRAYELLAEAFAG